MTAPPSALVGELSPFRLTSAELAPMIRAELKDKRYRNSDLGALVGRYIRWFRNEWGATPDTIRDYESVLAKMAITLADKDPMLVDIEDLREVRDLWADREAKTRAKVTSIMRAFWAWAEDQSFVPVSPAAKLRRPKVPQKPVALLPVNIADRLLTSAPTARDRLAVLILLDCGVRRAELRGIRIRDIDLGRKQLVVMGKGQKSRTIPLRGRTVMAAEEFLLEDLDFVGRQPEPDDYLLYPERRNPRREIYRAEPKKACALNTVHRWWYRQLEAAGLVGKGVRSGLNMHRARHTFATDARRAHGDIGGVQHLLGHSDPSTTIRLYGHYDQEDLERAIEALMRSREEAE